MVEIRGLDCNSLPGVGVLKKKLRECYRDKGDIPRNSGVEDYVGEQTRACWRGVE